MATLPCARMSLWRWHALGRNPCDLLCDGEAHLDSAPEIIEEGPIEYARRLLWVLTWLFSVVLENRRKRRTRPQVRSLSARLVPAE